MTRVNAVSSNGSVPDISPSSRKAVLFCPNCDRQATHEEWLVISHPRGADVYCPDCSSYLGKRRE